MSNRLFKIGTDIVEEYFPGAYKCLLYSNES